MSHRSWEVWNILSVNNQPVVIFSHEFSLISAVSFLLWLALTASWTTQLLVSSPRQQGGIKQQKQQKQHREHTVKLTTSQLIVFALLFVLASELPVHLTTPHEGLFDLIRGTDPLLDQVLARVPSLLSGPAPPLLLRNRHVQFLPFLIQNKIHKLRLLPYQRVRLTVSDCIDKRSYQCDAVWNDTVTIDIFPPFDDEDDGNATAKSSPHYPGFHRSSPVILFAPGLKCHSQDLPGTSIVRKAYGSGFRSVVVNRRGHTPDSKLQSPRWNLFGDVDDMEQVYWYVKRTFADGDTPFFLHGISSGTALAVTALSKWDRRRAEHPERASPAIVASVAVTPGYDIATVMRRERFLWPYNDVMLRGVKEYFVLNNEEVLRAHDNDSVDRLLNASSLQEIVDVAAVFAGYKNASDYYQDVNPINSLQDVMTPKLILNLVDDVSVDEYACSCCKVDLPG